MPLLSSTAFLKRLDATLGYFLCKALGYWRHFAGRPELAPDPDPARIHRILLIRPGGLGDMIMLLPVVRRIRAARPDIALDIVCERRNHAVLKLAGLEEHAILYDAHPLHMLKLRTNCYDVALDTEQFHNFSAIMALLSGAPVRAGFRINPSRLHLYTHLFSYDCDGYELDQFARLLAPLSISAADLTLQGALAGGSPMHFHGHAPADVTALRRARRVIAISPGSSDRYKQWGEAHFAEVIREMVARGHGIVLVGGENEAPQAKNLQRHAPQDQIINAVARCTLAETAGILASADLFLGGDSGLGHLAVALACPTLLLFGPSDPRKWSHAGAHHRVIRHALPCSPCSIFGYHKLCRNIPCMRGITVAEVLQAAEQELAVTRV